MWCKQVHKDAAILIRSFIHVLSNIFNTFNANETSIEWTSMHSRNLHAKFCLCCLKMITKPRDMALWKEWESEWALSEYRWMWCGLLWIHNNKQIYNNAHAHVRVCNDFWAADFVFAMFSFCFVREVPINAHKYIVYMPLNWLADCSTSRRLNPWYLLWRPFLWHLAINWNSIKWG